MSRLVKAFAASKLKYAHIQGTTPNLGPQIHQRVRTYENHVRMQQVPNTQVPSTHTHGRDYCF